MVWIVPFLSSNVEPCEFTQSFIKSVSIHTYIHTVVRMEEKKDRAALGVVR